jgi:hypothetical protein
MVKLGARTAVLAAMHGVALLGVTGCATGSGYSIATTAPFLSDQASSDQFAEDEDGGRSRRWRRFFIRRGDDGLLVETADTGGSGGAGLGGTNLASANGLPTTGLRYLIGNLASPVAGQIGGLTSPVASMTNALATNTIGALGAMPGGAIAQTLVNGGQNTTNLALASLNTQSAGLAGVTAGSTSNGVSVGVGGTSVSVGVGAGSGSVAGGGLTGAGVSVGVGGLPTVLPSGGPTVAGVSLGGITGGGLAAGVGLGGLTSGGLPTITTSTTNSGPGILGR